MTDAIFAAEAQAAAARARLGVTLATLQARIAPKALVQVAAQGLKAKGQAVAQDGAEIARRYPLTVAGAVAAVSLFLARRPIARLFARPPHATSLAPDSLTSKPPRAVKRKLK
ncbi:DUF3618 domain-containing protein [Sphingomonas qilianensis]|uniref:Phosphatase n=1 Tax=Sphingomonas qilianensis TaxID=1736690 RepID=A0ABU9XNS7_9SPHN